MVISFSSTAYRTGSASLSSEDAVDYPTLKEAILRCYDINEETHQHKFRSARRKEGEGFAELEARLRDMLRKWMAGCEDMEAEAVG